MTYCFVKLFPVSSHLPSLLCYLRGKIQFKMVCNLIGNVEQMIETVGSHVFNRYTHIKCK